MFRVVFDDSERHAKDGSCRLLSLGRNRDQWWANGKRRTLISNRNTYLQFRMSEINTANPRIPSPLTVGILPPHLQSEKKEI